MKTNTRISMTDVEAVIAIAGEVANRPDAAAMAEREYRRLVTENASLRLALGFYANGGNYATRNGYCPVMTDGGLKARMTLENFGG